MIYRKGSCFELYFISREVKVTEIKSSIFAAHSHSLHFSLNIIK